MTARCKWRHGIDGQFGGGFLDTVGGRVVYEFLDSEADYRVRGLTAEGDVAWDGSWEKTHNFFVFQEKLYLGGARARCVAPDDGVLVAEADLECEETTVYKPLSSGPVYSTSPDTRVVGLAPLTLDLLWEWPDPDVEYTPIDGWLIRYLPSGEITLVSLETMKEEIRVQAEPREALGAHLVVRGNLLCEFPLFSGGRRAVDLETGKTVWSFDEPRGLRMAALEGDRCYALTDGVSAFDVETGRRLWTQNFGHPERELRATPYVRDGRVYVCDSEGMVGVVEAETGRVLHRLDVGEPLEAVAALGGRHVVFATQGSIGCVELGGD